MERRVRASKREGLPAGLVPNRNTSPILDVEDDEETMKGFARVLENEGTATRRTRNGCEDVRFLRRPPVRMPRRGN